MSFDNAYEKIEKMSNEEITHYILTYHNDKSINETIDIETILFIAYDIKKYVPDKDTKNEITNRKYQHIFRNELIKKYKCCIITNKSHVICEAVHIVPYSENFNKRYDIYNGLLLCSELHKMFDKHLFSINTNNQIIFSNSVLNDEGFRMYKKYHEQKINLDKKIIMNLQDHYNTFMKLNGINVRATKK